MRAKGIFMCHKIGMCLAPLNQHQQTDFEMSSAASSERLIARNIGNRY